MDHTGKKKTLNLSQCWRSRRSRYDKKSSGKCSTPNNTDIDIFAAPDLRNLLELKPPVVTKTASYLFGSCARDKNRSKRTVQTWLT